MQTKKARIISSVCSACAAAVFQIVFCLAGNMGVQIAASVAAGVLFLLPFILNLRYIKEYKIDKVRRFIVSDLIFVITPAALMSVVTEAAMIPFSEVSYTVGIGSLIFLLILLLLAAVFWLLYWIADKIY